MKYSIRRFSYQEALQDGSEYFLSQVDSGIGKIEDLSTKIIENPKLKDLKPVKRHVKLVNSVSKLLRRKKKKKKSKEYSETDPTVSLNLSEVNKFKTALNRLTNSTGSGNTKI